MAFDLFGFTVAKKKTEKTFEEKTFLQKYHFSINSGDKKRVKKMKCKTNISEMLSLRDRPNS